MRHEQNRMVFKTPLGWAGVSVSEEGISRIVLPKKERKAVEKELNSARCASPLTPALSPEGRGRTGVLDNAVQLLRQYFTGERVLFDLPLDMRYYTAFQQTVWKAAGEIPFGETRSYGWVAKKIKKPKAGRAVGQALGANPFPIIIPCHRVINATGGLGGFSGGLGVKKRLLELETETNDCH